MIKLVNSKFASSFLTLFVGIWIVGLTTCENPGHPRGAEPNSAATVDASRRSFGSPPGDSLTPGNLDIEQVADEAYALNKAVVSASTWKEADRKVRAILTSSSSVPQFVREQEAAHKMFNQYFNTDGRRANLTEEKVEVLGFYTDLLVRNRSPESDLVYAGLQKLDDHWSTQRIIDAAESTIRAAKRKYGSAKNSAGSQSDVSERDEPSPGVAESRERHANRVLEFNRKLRNLADRKHKSR